MYCPTFVKKNYMNKPLLITAVLFLWGIGLIFAQDKTISGKIVSTEKSEPLIGVTINAKGTTKSTITDIDGNFTLSVDEKDSLVISYVGFVTKVVPVGSQTKFDIVLQPDIEQLEEVVVVGYGVLKKSDLTGSLVSLKAEDLAKIATADPIQMLQGRAAGVQVTNNSGEPGAGMVIRVRGTGTVNNSDPLYVVDGFQTGDISFLNPADIESTEILKDASATAIYGSRGANGVVMITTKKGKGDDGKVRFDFNSTIGFQELRKKIDMVNASEFAKLRYDALKADNVVDADTYTHLDFLRNKNLKGTDWQDELTQRGLIQNYSLNITGGNRATRWGVSGNFYDQAGTIKNSGIKKYFFKANMDMELSKWLKGGVTVSYAKADKTNTAKDIYGGSLTTALVKDPAARAWDPNINNWGAGPLSGDIANPARVNDFQKYNKYYDDYVVANSYLEATIIPGLTFKTQLNGSFKNFLVNSYTPTYAVSPNETNNLSSLYQQRGNQTYWQSSNYLNYTKTLLKDHSVNATVGAEAQEFNYNAIDASATNVPESADLRYFTTAPINGIVNPSGGTYQGSNSLVSLFGRTNYSYKGRYSLTATLRYDGSSRFRPGKRFGLFPSLGLSWNVTEENFMKNLAVISLLKARVGYGAVGNQGSVGDYDTYVPLSGNFNYVFNNIPVAGFTTTRLGNPSLIWESTQTFNAGVDLSLLRNSITFTADYYIRDTKGMIIPAPAPTYVGSSGPSANVGSIRNSGIELSLRYKNKIGKLNYEIGGNLARNKNEVTFLGNKDQGATPLPGGGVDKVGSTTLLEVGRELYYFFGYKTDGIFNTQEELDAYTAVQPNASLGDVKYVDVNGDGVISALDRTYLGSAQPDFTYGLNASADFMNFDLSINAYGVHGAEIANALNRYTMSSDGITNSRRDRLNAWTPQNPTSNEPRMTYIDKNQNIALFSDRYIEDGSFFRLQNITFGYTIPQQVMSKVKINTLRVFIAVDNLFVLTKYKGWDPEIGQGNSYGGNSASFAGVDIGSYPLPRTYRTGVSLKF